MTTDTVTDVLIVGGGYAGLSAASTLYRATHSTIVFDSNIFRDNLAPQIRLLPGFEGASSDRYREVARTELEKTGLCSFVNSEVTEVEKIENGLWKLTTEDGNNWLGKKIILATGVDEIYPDIAGYEDCWVTGIFPCLFQFGYEERGVESAGILVVNKLAQHLPQVVKLAGDANKFARNVNLYTNGDREVTANLEPLVQGTNFRIRGCPIRRLVKQKNRAEVVVELDDDTVITEGFLVHQPYTKLRGQLPERLGLEMTPFGDIKVQHPFPATSVPGIYAAGDCASPFKNASMAIAAGVCAGNGVARELPGSLEIEVQ
ncbi:hypothetical protein LOZ12_002787 [Ophidiomyces ophidiicola]|nr:hypothetical protein LOZ62_001578 [Ophidiomyces ophidiicola]KAI2055200.1 hypothetical protein LOZ38_000799 [Ophidiomyces ophidiicola]KAI2077427.1 hypothetical protein LOZ39_002175 [Ophidiomyces ophidiicola]KAI2080527.1 hypothetical protein LOZ37_001527 [Ophidiomyces ophidiicola]KAI2098454.1 hypothetical protein LOZ35_001774 [Ophidiomyces ophidiicola]